MNQVKTVYPTDENGKPILVAPYCGFKDRFSFWLVYHNPHRINEMGGEDIRLILEHPKVHRKRVYTDHEGNKLQIAPTRALLQQRRDLLIKKRAEVEAYKNILEAIRQFYEESLSVSSNVKADHHRETDRAIRIFGSRHRNSIFDIAPIPLNLISVSAYASELPIAKLTNEHVFPRTWYSTMLIELFFQDEPPTMSEFVAKIIPGCCITYVMSTENNDLGVYQRKNKDKFTTPAALYEAVGVQLIDMHAPIKLPWQWKAVCSTFGVDLESITFPTFPTVDPQEVLSYN